MKIKNTSALIISILIPLTVGAVSAALSGGSSAYAVINKPEISPPGILFPIVWTILYILMGISCYIIYSSGDAGSQKALKVYAVQLAFNFFWSIIFFGLRCYLFAFLWLVILILLIALMIYTFYQINRLAAYLQIPYLLWCIFAAYLNFMVYRLN